MKIFIAALLILISHHGSCQIFEGAIRYKTYFMEKGTNSVTTGPISETVFIKGSKYKIQVDSAEQGMLDWQLVHYKTNYGYIRKSYRSSTVPIYSEDPKIDSNGKISFGKPIENPVPPIIRYKICNFSDENKYDIIGYDTIIINNGIRNKILVVMLNNKRIAEYWYAIDFNLDPSQYSCELNDLQTLIHKFTKGKILSKRFDFTDEYFDILYELDEIKKVNIPDQDFDLPSGIEIVDETNK